MNRLEQIKECVAEGIRVKNAMIEDTECLKAIDAAVEMILDCYRKDGGLFICGNGGSAADAQHIAAELVGRFYYDRPPLRAEALTTNTSDLTCIGNDYSYEHIFSRALKGKGRKGDVLLAITTSGNSPNVVAACQAAREMGIKVIGLGSQRGGKIATLCDVVIKIPSADTPRIQEGHILVGHTLCQLVEAELFPKA